MIKLIKIFLCFTIYVAGIVTLMLLITMSNSTGLSLCFTAIILFITGKFFDLLTTSLITDDKPYEFYDTKGQETPAYGWKDKTPY